jgi:hypothetical protein
MVVVVVAVDERDVDVVLGAGALGGVEDGPPDAMAREVAKVADLQDERAVLITSDCAQVPDPT